MKDEDNGLEGQTTFYISLYKYIPGASKAMKLAWTSS